MEHEPAQASQTPDGPDTRIVAASDYDQLVNWEARLGREAGLYRRVFSMVGARRVADIGCGSGRHSIMFAEWGLDVLGLDPSESMLLQADANARAHAAAIESAGGRLEFFRAGFGELAPLVGVDKVDAIVCAGNALPHVDGVEGLRVTLSDFADSMRAGGVLVLHLLNHTRLLQRRPKMIPPVHRVTEDGEKIFLRVLDYPEGGKVIGFDFLTLHKGQDGAWSVSNRSSHHTALPVDLITTELSAAGFEVFESAGGHDGKKLQILDDESVVILARRRRHLR